MLSTSLPNLSWKSDDEVKKRVQPFIIGVAGGTASGKTSVCYEVIKKLGIDIHRVALVSQDSFYKPLSKEEREHVHDYNFDHPGNMNTQPIDSRADAFDWPLIEQTLIDLKAGKAAKIPVYDFVTHSRIPETTSICAIDIILFEGILVFYFPNITKMFDMKIFVDTDADTRLARRIVRDIRERGRELEGVLHQYSTFVKPSFEEYCSPTKKFADVIIPRGADNHVAIDLIVQHLRLKLGERRKATKISKLHNVRTPSKKPSTETTVTETNNNDSILNSPPVPIHKKHNDLDPLSLETHNNNHTQFEFDS